MRIKIIIAKLMTQQFAVCFDFLSVIISVLVKKKNNDFLTTPVMIN